LVFQIDIFLVSTSQK